MEVNWSVGKGSGRATCKICNKKIQKSELQVSVEWSGNVHFACIEELAKKVGGIKNVV